jgi:hypothetical protein
MIVPVDRGAADAERPGDLRGALTTRLGGGQLVRVHHGRPSAVAPLSLGRDEACHGALVDDVPLEFGEGGHHGEEELALAGRAVGAGQLPSEDLDADAALVQVVGDRQHVLDGAAEAVELPDDKGVKGFR